MSMPSDRDTGASVVVRADWDDLDAALELAVRKVEAAVVVRRDPAPGRAEFEIVTATDEPGILTATAGEAPGPRPIPIRLEARVGRFGDRDREGRVLQAWRARLEQLAGVDWAPAR